jgi:aryl-alcohol dehydrogenase-like predicted oxidoreductase
LKIEFREVRLKKKVFHQMNSKLTRRNFLLTSLASAGTIVGCAGLTQQTSARLLLPKTLPERELGNTGIKVPLLGLGGAGKTPLSWQGQETAALEIIEKALSLGIRYYDTAASYGPSEDYLGKVLPPYREEVFLASKTGFRDRDGAWRELERSLHSLNTDYLDLWQLHHVSFTEDLAQIFSSHGAIKAVEEAKEQKIIRFTGITGHHEPDVIIEGLNRYPFDTTLISINAADVHHPRPFSTSVLPVTQAKKIGVIAMKVPAYGKLFQPGILTGMEQAFGYVMSLKGVDCCIIAAENPEQLEGNVRVAQAFRPLPDSDLRAIEQLTAHVWEENSFFRQWT